MPFIFQTAYSNAFYWIRMYEFQLKFHWSLFLRVQLTISHHWFRYWLGTDQATSHCLKQWWLVLAHICVTRPHWVNEWDFAQLHTRSSRFHFYTPEELEQRTPIQYRQIFHITQLWHSVQLIDLKTDYSIAWCKVIWPWLCLMKRKGVKSKLDEFHKIMDWCRQKISK